MQETNPGCCRLSLHSGLPRLKKMFSKQAILVHRNQHYGARVANVTENEAKDTIELTLSSVSKQFRRM